MLYATEGARSMMDRTLADYPWQVRVIVDGVDVEVPEDAEGVLIANIGSYMGGVDLWQNENHNNDNFDPQSMHDKRLEVVSISETWHLEKLQVRLDRAQRLAQWKCKALFGCWLHNFHMYNKKLNAIRLLKLQRYSTHCTSIGWHSGDKRTYLKQDRHC